MEHPTGDATGMSNPIMSFQDEASKPRQSPQDKQTPTEPYPEKPEPTSYEL